MSRAWCSNCHDFKQIHWHSKTRTGTCICCENIIVDKKVPPEIEDYIEGLERLNL